MVIPIWSHTKLRFPLNYYMLACSYAQLLFHRLPPPPTPTSPMVEIPEHLSVVDDFYKFLISVEVQAIIPRSPLPNGSRPFIPADKLQCYLTEPVIRKLLAYHGLPATEYRPIKTSHLVVFAILVYIRKGVYITQFLRHDRLADDHLPFLSDNELPHDCKEFFPAFYEAQWMFYAQHLRRDRLNDTCFEDKLIIPITSSTALSVGPDSCTYKVEIYKGCNELLDRVRILYPIPTRNYSHRLTTCADRTMSLGRTPSY
jgi:hypothetical protein